MCFVSQGTAALAMFCPSPSLCVLQQASLVCLIVNHLPFYLSISLWVNILSGASWPLEPAHLLKTASILKRTI